MKKMGFRKIDFECRYIKVLNTQIQTTLYKLKQEIEQIENRISFFLDFDFFVRVYSDKSLQICFFYDDEKKIHSINIESDFLDMLQQKGEKGVKKKDLLCM